MAYQLGVDLGTTYSAGALHRDGRVEIVSLGSRATAIPSVVYVAEDGSVLTGEQASRRAVTSPRRVAREFKRRLGDTTPILIGGTPYSAEQLTARLLRAVVDEVTKLEGGPPDKVAVSHPANWGPFKVDLLEQAIRLADLHDVELVTEPEAAAISYASTERVERDDVVAVYDLGGGTFDAAVLRKTEEGFDTLGKPEGIEHLGGIDFDAAVFDHVCAGLRDTIEQLDPSDSATLVAVARLRQECVEAKEALSSEADVTIPVLLPNKQTEVRLTRAELEAMVRVPLSETIGALRRALESAGVGAPAVKAVLLVGGSSRVPLVAQLVSAELGRPVAVDAHPKHAIALGTALVAARAASGVGPEQAVVVPPDETAEASAAAVSADDEPYGFWFYVEEPEWLVSPYDETQTVGVLQPGQWYLAGEQQDEWVYAADERGAEGWVPLYAVRRDEV
ncbi:MAG: Hsp70 family protein [Actinomycetota bacterium]